MIVSYDDIIETREAVLGRGETVDHIELTEAALDDLKSDLTPATYVSGHEPESIPEGVVGRVQSFDVYEGDMNVIVTERGAKYRL